MTFSGLGGALAVSAKADRDNVAMAPPTASFKKPRRAEKVS
jgi:hypothetical protein